MVIIWVTPIMVTPTTMVTMERGAPRLTPGCTTAILVTDSTHTAMVIMVWAMLPMPDITRTLTMEAAEMATEPWFPVLPGNSVEV